MSSFTCGTNNFQSRHEGTCDHFRTANHCNNRVEINSIAVSTLDDIFVTYPQFRAIWEAKVTEGLASSTLNGLAGRLLLCQGVPHFECLLIQSFTASGSDDAACPSVSGASMTSVIQRPPISNSMKEIFSLMGLGGDDDESDTDIAYMTTGCGGYSYRDNGSDDSCSETDDEETDDGIILDVVDAAPLRNDIKAGRWVLPGLSSFRERPFPIVSASDMLSCNDTPRFR